ncbi:MAG: methyltransferase domain-containing protein [Ignavibacteria bacterium]
MKNYYVIRFFKQTGECGSILDYGSGFSPYKGIAEKAFTKYYTAEFYKSDEIRYESNSDFIISEDETTNCKTDFFDVVLLTEVLEHIYKPLDSLREVNRILKPGGTLAGTIPFIKNEHDEPNDFFRYTSYALKRLLAESGYINAEVTYIGDIVGSFIQLYSRIAGIPLKILFKLKLGVIAAILNSFVIKIPEYIYFYLYISGLRFGRISRLRQTPLGFFFTAVKPKVTQRN